MPLLVLIRPNRNLHNISLEWHHPTDIREEEEVGHHPGDEWADGVTASTTFHAYVEDVLGLTMVCNSLGKLPFDQPQLPSDRDTAPKFHKTTGQ